MTEQNFPIASKAKRTGPRWIAGLAIIAVVVGAGYGLLSRNNASTGGSCVADDMAARLKPLAQGDVAAFSVNTTPVVLPALSLMTTDGRKVTLDAFKGKTVLLNLWATWCVPCRREMPALDALQKELGGKDFEVVAISVDTGGPEKPKKWLADNGIQTLGFYGDIDGNVLKSLQKSGQAVGLPTTLLIDPQGCQRGIVRGPAEWAGADALKLLRAALGRS